MNIDLNICGGFILNTDENMDDEALYELIQEIEKEVNSALSMIAYRHKLGFAGIEFQTEE